MKSLVVLISLLCFHQSAIAQKIHFTDTSNFWYATGVDSSGITFTTYYLYNGSQTFGANTYRSLISTTTANQQYVNGVDLIREDTAAGIVYRYDNVVGTEHVLYNYNLGLGDTIHHFSDIMWSFPLTADTATIDSVVGIDSILINGIYHKVFSFVEIDTLHNHYSSWSPYLTVIEGIGSVFDPASAQYRAMYYGQTVFLTCFTSLYGTSGPAINLPFTYPAAGNTHVFINNCASVDAPQLNTDAMSVMVRPNPIEEISSIVLSQPVARGNFIVFNSIGQVVVEMSLSNSKEILIGEKITKSGLYYYKIVDRTTGSIYTGKLLKQ